MRRSSIHCVKSVAMAAANPPQPAKTSKKSSIYDPDTMDADPRVPLLAEAPPIRTSRWESPRYGTIPDVTDGPSRRRQQQQQQQEEQLQQQPEEEDGGGNNDGAAEEGQDDDEEELMELSGVAGSCFCHPQRAVHKMIALFLMCLLGFGSYFCFDNPGALQNEIRDVMGISTFQFANLYAWYSWPNVFLPIVGGYLIDTIFGLRFGAAFFAMALIIGECPLFFFFWRDYGVSLKG